VASNALGNVELLDEYPGDLFPAEDAGALASLLRRCHATRPPKVRHDLGPYSLDVVLEQTEAAYRALIARKRGS
jgi:hypothetical protein